MNEPNVILLGVTGSTAYGMATPSSDVDRQGIFQVDTWDLLGRMGKGEDSSDTIQEHDPDVAMHELGKYVRLAADANPTAFEVLWLAEYDVLTEAGKMLVDHRHLFLSQRVKQRYAGYAKAQVERLLKRGFDANLRPAKHGRHVVRLLFQAEQILSNHHLTVRLQPDEVDTCFAWGNLAEADPQSFAEKALPAIERLDQIPSGLPEKPDMDAIRDLLVTIRLRGI